MSYLHDGYETKYFMTIILAPNVRSTLFMPDIIILRTTIESTVKEAPGKTMASWHEKKMKIEEEGVVTPYSVLIKVAVEDSLAFPHIDIPA